VLDAGQRGDRFVSLSHGFLGHDGASPGEIAAKGKAEVLVYPTVTWRDELVIALRATSSGFIVDTASGERQASRLIIATGVVDEPPTIPGLAERWGKSVFHCPYCDGYELDRGRLGVLATSPLSIHYAQIVAEWSAPGQTTLFLDEKVEPSPEQLSELGAHGIGIEPEEGRRRPGSRAWHRAAPPRRPNQHACGPLRHAPHALARGFRRVAPLRDRGGASGSALQDR
jgi:thioredoxin reductase